MFGLLKENMTNMKNLITLFFGLLCMSSFAAEAIVDSRFGTDSVQCVRNRSIYREFVKQKNYDDAIQPWSWAYANCPQSSKNIFIRNYPICYKLFLYN